SCAGENGQGIFDLNEQDATILGSQNPDDYSVSYHTSLEDAENGVNTITNPESFSSTGQTIFVRVTDNVTSCYSITQFELLVSPLPIVPVLPDIELCAGGLMDGTAVFDLTVQEAIILQEQTDVSISYHLSEADAENGTNAIITPESYNNSNNP